MVLFLLYAFVHRRLAAHARHVAAGPPTSDLRTEPPAVVNLLVNRLELTPDAVAAAVLDLAAQRELEIFQVGPGHSVLRLHRGDSTIDARLPVHERQLLDVARAGATDGDITVAQLTTALGPGSATTWAQFSRAVRADATQLGLVRRAGAGRGVSGPSFAMGITVGAGIIVTVPPLWLLAAVACGVATVAGIIVLVWGRGLVPTPEGRAATAHWLGVRRFLAEQDNLEDLPPAAVAVWDQYLAYGAALGESPAAVHGLGDEVRTRMSLADWNHLARVVADPKVRAAEMRKAGQAQLTQMYGRADLGPFGPDDGDFWTLVERTARGWAPGMSAVMYDPPGWGAAVERRIAALRAAAPPDVAGAVEELAPTIQRIAASVATNGPSGLDAAEGVDTSTGPLADPVHRLLAAAGAHFGCPPEPEALALRLGLANPGG